MIQLRKLRTSALKSGDIKSTDEPFMPDIHVPTLQDLFLHLQSHVKKIPESERFNIYYTVGQTNASWKRLWFGQAVIPFDIDHVVDETGYSDNEKLIEVIFEAIGADPDKAIVVHSGNGLQFLIQTRHPIPEGGESFFRVNISKYAEMCSAINAALKANDLRGEADISSFAPNRLMRLPGTENRKPDKKTRQATLLRGNLQPQDFSIAPPAPGVRPQKEPWEAGVKEQISGAWLSTSKLDTPSILAGCEFLKKCKAEPDDIDEPQWYAMLGVLGRLEDGERLAHEYSSGAGSYSEAATTRKLTQALAGSMPRTCENINSLWQGCHTCRYNQLVKSPVGIKANDFIATEDHGFHSVQKGELVPEVEDLRKYFTKDRHYKTSIDANKTYVYDGKKYLEWIAKKIQAYAYEKFEPALKRPDVLQHFATLVSLSNVVDSGWFADSTKDLVNFNNGAYHLKENTLLPHEPCLGFRYVLPYDFDSAATCPTFDKFMSEISCGDESLETLMLEFVGYAICDQDYEHHKALILLGEGSNGKSTFINIIRRVIGFENISHLTYADLKSETARSGLDGKILNACEELSHKDMQETDSFKNLFGGVTRARKLYNDAGEFRNLTKFMFAGNSLPPSPDQSKGYWRRQLLAPFDANFDTPGAVDHTLMKRMTEELPGIFNRVIRTYQKMVDRGDFIFCQRSHDLLETHKAEQDPIGTWLKENLRPLPYLGHTGPRVSVSNLFTSYNAERIAHNEKCPTRKSFTKALNKFLDNPTERHVRIRVGKEREFVIWGYELIDHGANF